MYRRLPLLFVMIFAACRNEHNNAGPDVADATVATDSTVITDTATDADATEPPADTANTPDTTEPPADTANTPDATEPPADTANMPDATEPPADTTTASDTSATDTVVTRRNTCTAPASAAVAEASVPPGFCASIWAKNLTSPRGLFVAENGDVLVVESGRVTALWDADGDGLSGSDERIVLAQANGLNHGVTVHAGYLYASTQTTVYRWPYSPRTALGASETVINGMPNGGHATRTLVFDRDGKLYVSVGSGSNVDSDSSRARIRRFDIAAVPPGGIAFNSGEVFADGLRNEVGLAFDASGTLWGVQNGMDQLRRDDLGGDIHDDNPAEILSRFDRAGAFHGYPYCWTEFLLPAGVGAGRGAMWAHGTTMNDGTHTDAWCKNPANVQPPALAMQAHSAPLDLTFYDGASFPAELDGDLFITFHGSWNRDVPTGYKVVRVAIDAAGNATGPETFFEHQGGSANGWPHRPVAVKVGKDGQLFVSSDASGTIIVIGHQ